MNLERARQRAQANAEAWKAKTAELVAAKPSRGLGDTVAKVIRKVTRGRVKPCTGCKKRQEKLNKLLPYAGKESSSVYTE